MLVNLFLVLNYYTLPLILSQMLNKTNATHEPRSDFIALHLLSGRFTTTSTMGDR